MDGFDGEGYLFTAAQALGWFKCAGALAGWAHGKNAGEMFPILSPGLAALQQLGHSDLGI